MDIFRCTICCDTCVNPTTASCLSHTFCLSCLADWIRSCRARGVVSRCPSCNHPLDNDPEDLRVNTDIAHAIEVIRASTVSLQMPPSLLRQFLARIQRDLFRTAHITRRQLWDLTGKCAADVKTQIRACALLLNASVRLAYVPSAYHRCVWRSKHIHSWMLIVGALLIFGYVYLLTPGTVTSTISTIYTLPVHTTFTASKNIDSHLNSMYGSSNEGETESTLILRKVLLMNCHDLSNIPTGSDSLESDSLEQLMTLGTLADLDLEINAASRSMLRALQLATKAVGDSGSIESLFSFCARHQRYLSQSITRDDDVPTDAPQRVEISPADAWYSDWKKASRGDLERGAAEGFPAARAALGDELNASKNYTRAIALWRLAAADGQGDALVALGHAFTSGTEGVPQDFVQAAHFYSSAAAKVHYQAFGPLGLAFLEGRGVRKSTVAAVLNFRRGVALHDPYAMYNLAVLTSRGEVVPRDAGKAMKLMKAAALGGCKAATKFVNL